MFLKDNDSLQKTNFVASDRVTDAAKTGKKKEKKDGEKSEEGAENQE